MLALLPLGLLLLSLILLLIPLAFPAKDIEIDTLTVPSALNRSMAYTAAVLYPVFLILLDQGYGIAALSVLLLLYLVCWPAILRAVDWQLLVTFILMFVVAAFSGFVLGGLWYSPVLFGKVWMHETGVTEDKAKDANMIKKFSIAFLASLVICFNLAMFLGAERHWKLDCFMASWPASDGWQWPSSLMTDLSNDQLN